MQSNELLFYAAVVARSSDAHGHGTGSHMSGSVIMIGSSRVSGHMSRPSVVTRFQAEQQTDSLYSS